MKKFFNRKNLVILGFILVLIGIPLTIFILKNQTILKSRASDSEEPRDVKITNITNTSFTITYRTESPSTGSISYGIDKKLGESELEDIDKAKGSFSPKKIHSISIRKLIPTTKYYLTIISGSSTFLNNGVPFETTTGPNISSVSAKQQIIKGKIILSDGNASPETLVYLNAENSQLLSDITTKNGEFSFSLKELRTDDLSSYFDTNEATVFTIIATNGSLKSTTLASFNKNDSIPTITLSNDYNFIQKVSPVASKSAESSGFPSIAPSKKILKPEIINPKENQSFTDQKPQFRGTSVPNEKVEIIIRSIEEITTQVIADSNGNWTYKPSANLSPGKHTITIKTKDSQGILTTIVQSFTVFAAESPTLTPATPSATPIQKIIPTITPTPTIAALLIPTATLAPISSPTIAPITAKGDLPPTGDSRIIFIALAAIAITATGMVLFRLTQKMPL